MLNFDKPNYKVVDKIESSNYGKFEIEPLERGFGMTIGNALRRVLLSSLPGTAITSVKIDGVQHEFQKIDGVYEDVVQIILNLKGVIFRNYSKEEKVLSLTANEEGEVTAAQFSSDPDIEIVNPKKVIATLSKGASLSLEVLITNGRGYVRAEENKKKMLEGIIAQNVKNGMIDVIPMDSLYSPIVRVNYEVEPARVGQDDNYDKLVMEIWTNGAIRPEESITLASQIIVEHFQPLSTMCDTSSITSIIEEENVTKGSVILDKSIEELDFSVRAYNCLKRAGIETLNDLSKKTESEMLKIRNLGQKSLKEVIEKAKKMGVKFAEEKN